MEIGRNAALFGLGGSAYVGLEYLYRGRSHISMFGAGGLCFLLIGRLGKSRLPVPVRVGAGAGIITAVEYVTGILVNRDHHVWDYRDRRGNIQGQVCPMFMALWVPVSAMAMGLYALAERGMDSAFPRRRLYRPGTKALP